MGLPRNQNGIPSQSEWDCLAVEMDTLAIGMGYPRNWNGITSQLEWDCLAVGIRYPRHQNGIALPSESPAPCLSIYCTQKRQKVIEDNVQSLERRESHWRQCQTARKERKSWKTMSNSSPSYQTPWIEIVSHTQAAACEFKYGGILIFNLYGKWLPDRTKNRNRLAKRQIDKHWNRVF